MLDRLETSRDASPQHPDYRTDIDGLRALAVTSVVLSHANVPWLTGGFVGVDVFFVISGFLIGGIIYRSVGLGTFSFAEFYSRRAKRILPALIAVMCFMTVAGLVLLSPAEFSQYLESAIAALFGGSNIYFWQNVSYFGATAGSHPLLMTWSLGVEEQFYLLFPFLLLGCHRFMPRWTLPVVVTVTILSLLASIGLTWLRPRMGFYLLPARAWEMGIGVILAIWMAQGGRIGARASHWLSATGLAAIVLCCIFLNESMYWPGYLALVPVLGTAAIIASPLARLNLRGLSASPIVFVGLISYSWYLWHWPLLAFVRICSPGEASRWAIAGAVILSFGLAIVSWRYVERPFRETKRTTKAILNLYGRGMAATAGALGTLYLAGDQLSAASPKLAAVDQVRSITHDFPCLVGEDYPNLEAVCVNTSAGHAIAIVGDSHAAAFAPEIKAIAKASGRGYAMFGKGTCRPLVGVNVWKQDDPWFGEACRRYVDTSFEQIRSDPRIETVVLAGNWAVPLRSRFEDYVRADGQKVGNEADLLLAGLRGSIEYFKRAGKRVIVLEDTPYFRFDPARAALARVSAIRGWLASGFQPDLDVSQGIGPSIEEPARAQEIERLARDTGVTYVKSRNKICRQTDCRFMAGDALLFADPSHISPEGARLLLGGAF